MVLWPLPAAESVQVAAATLWAVVQVHPLHLPHYISQLIVSISLIPVELHALLELETGVCIDLLPW